MHYLFSRRKYIERASVSRIDIRTASVSLPSGSYAYTGEPITPPPYVTYGDYVLVANDDYTVQYEDNVNQGLATVIITGLGRFYGSRSTTFYIRHSRGWDEINFYPPPLGYFYLPTLPVYVTLTDGNVPMYTRNLQVLPDGSLHFGSLTGNAYTWGFEANNPFQIKHFKSIFDSKSDYMMYMGSSLLSEDGTKGVLCPTSTDNSYGYFSLSTPFDLTTRNIIDWGHPGFPPERMAFSRDGSKFFYKAKFGDTMYCLEMATPFDLSTAASSPSATLTNTALSIDSTRWRGFTFSPDGKFLVAIYGNGGTDVAIYSISEAWNIASTITKLSSVTLTNDSSNIKMDAVAINDEGTKMIAHDSNTGRFYKYNLTANGHMDPDFNDIYQS